MAEIWVHNDELCTIREAMRELHRMIQQLEQCELDKVVLTQRNRMRAVVVSAERFAQLQRLETHALPAVVTGANGTAHLPAYLAAGECSDESEPVTEAAQAG
jgi:PHD/YefM family antitoxin component YafN of YafNO toxin-antitoxin module